MFFCRLFALSGLLLLTSSVFAQLQKRAMTVDDLVQWKRITERKISDDGSLIAVKNEPWKGDAALQLYDAKGNEVREFSSVADFEFSASSRYLVVKEVPTEADVEALKLKNTKADQMPVDRLVIYSSDKKEHVIDSIRRYVVSETSDWLAYKRGGRKDSTLYISSLDGFLLDSIPLVADFGFAKEGDALYYVTKDSLLAGLYKAQPAKKTYTLIHKGEGDFEKVTFNKAGDKLAFLYTASTDSLKKKNEFALYVSNEGKTAAVVAERGNAAFPKDWVISANGTLKFSDKSDYLSFGTAPKPRERDTTQLAENRPHVQVWNWDESVQHTQQVIDKDRDSKATYTAIYRIGDGKLLQLGSLELPNVQLPDNGDWALLSTTEPYGTERMWRGRSRSDVYKANIHTGELKPLKIAADTRMRISPAGLYAYWYNEPDSSWYSYSLKDGKEYRLTTPASFVAWDEDNDVPDYPRAHGLVGWTDKDDALLIYDRYDIWKFSPTAAVAPTNLTVSGRRSNIRYRFVELDRDAKTINLSQKQVLTGFNEKTKGYGFYSATFNSAASPKELIAGDYMLAGLTKAKKSDAVIYSLSSYEQYPEVTLSDLTFKKNMNLTKLGAQEEPFIWGTAELISWTSLDGVPLEGVIYKPANFDPNKKYPLLVNFYERNSDGLHSYRGPEPHRSTIDYRLYNSNGYIVFNPDIRYKIGYPGESCFNSVMPGISAVVAKGYINEDAIGAQGHSWGGYQVAYLATRTNMFAAIESGAPVVNMYSAYGGIRWWTGLNRSFQYEHTQSRIGATPWEASLRYQENSPIFTMDKVNTPILIMHNDADGHVPWEQGIEYFVALKRLQKPVWMLNYPGEPHWPVKMPNRIDFQKRMFQFFDHYLKDAPMPKWMSEGVKATDEPYELGY